MIVIAGPLRIGRLSLAASLAVLVLAAAGPAAAASSGPAGTGLSAQRACPGPARPGYAQCLALVATAAGTFAVPDASGAPAGYGPASLRSAYNITHVAKVAGRGRTVAVVDAYNDPRVAADLNAYRSHYRLPPCTTAGGCFRKAGQAGTAAYPGNGNGWSEEISLDLDMVSAVCPECRILLVEASSPADADLAAAEDEAVKLGAGFVSNSYGGPEWSGETMDNAGYRHPGVPITASAGDYGYGTEFPAVAPGVTAVGGTSLHRAPGTRRGWAETAWPGTGSGCSPYEPAPSWQPAAGGCSGRMAVDVSADADLSTGVAVYDTEGGRPGWMLFGGTSVAAPIIAGMYALAGPPPAGTDPASFGYAHFRHSYDVTSGSNSSQGCSPSVLCAAGTGYDGPTGMGTPDGTGAYRQVINTVTVRSPGPQSSRRGLAIKPVTVRAADSSAAQRLYWSGSGLPAGLSLDHLTGRITGRPRFRTGRTVTVTVADHTGAWAAVKFSWHVHR